MQGQETSANTDLGNTHYWSVRGRGFSDKQWRALLNATSDILSNAKDENIAVAGPDGDGDPVFFADKIVLNGSIGNMGEPFVLRRTMSDHPFESCKTYNNDYEVVVSSILTAAKKIAPDVIELSAYGDPEPRRILAMFHLKNALKLAATNSKIRSAVLPLIIKNANLNNENIRKAVLALAARDPRVREALGRNLQAKFPEGKSVDVGKWLRDNGHADAAEKWEKYEGEMDGKQKTAFLRAVIKTAQNLTSDKTAGDDPYKSKDQKIKKLISEVEKFLYPKGSDARNPRGDVSTRDYTLLMDFYQGQLSEGDWRSIPKVLEKAKKQVKTAQNLTKDSLVKFLKDHGEVTVQELNYAFGGGSQKHTAFLKKLVQEGVLVRDGTKYRLKKASSSSVLVKMIQDLGEE